MGKIAEIKTAMLAKWLCRFPIEQSALWAIGRKEQIQYVWDWRGWQPALQSFYLQTMSRGLDPEGLNECHTMLTK